MRQRREEIPETLFENPLSVNPNLVEENVSLLLFKLGVFGCGFECLASLLETLLEGLTRRGK